MTYERTVEEIAETIQYTKKFNKGCCLLIGAGCSVQGGIPIAREIIEQIEKDYPRAYQRAVTKNYPECMAQLTYDQRRTLISRYITNSKINWAHICIALLVKYGYVDRILTTNFDPLIIRACAFLGEYPAVYDTAASQLFKPEFIPEKAVFYLHGQHTGFVFMNTEKECQEQAKRLKPVFEHTGSARTWIVVGYSGENDPVFTHLTNFSRFDNHLYWIGYKNNPIAAHVWEQLLSKENDAYYTGGYDADSFFVELTKRLGIFPPEFISKPFSFLSSLLSSLAPYNVPGQQTPIDVASGASVSVKAAIEQFEANNCKQQDSEGTTAKCMMHPHQLMSLLLEGDYERIIASYPQYINECSEEILDIFSWAYIMKGNDLYNQAKADNRYLSDELYTLAYKNYNIATRIKSDKHEAFNNWGNALSDQAATKSSDEADQLYFQAYEKYTTAINFKNDKYETYNNWGNALAAQAGHKEGSEADRLYKAAYEKYEMALGIKPDDYEALYNWGNALYSQAKKKNGHSADMLYALAYKMYAETLTVKPDDYETLYNWANALYNQAKKKEGISSNSLYSEAFVRYEQALAVRPNCYEAYNNWGNALSDQAASSQGAEADRLYNLAYEKYREALKTKPDSHETYNNWGNAILDQAHNKAGDEADALYSSAYEKYNCALLIKPEDFATLYNWGNAIYYHAKKSGQTNLFHAVIEKFLCAEKIRPGAVAYDLACVYALLGKEEICREWLHKGFQYRTLPDCNRLQNDEDLAALVNKGWFRRLLADLKNEKHDVISLS